MARSSLYRRFSFFIVHRILHTDDTPGRIARGLAIGIFVAWLPLIGLQMLIILGLSFILRANKLVGLPAAWISNPFTLVPVYYPSYLLGSAILGSGVISIQDFEHRFGDIFLSALSWPARLEELASLIFTDFFYPTLIGSIPIGLIIAVACYFLSVRAIKRHRNRRLQRRARKLSRLSQEISNLSSEQATPVATDPTPQS